VLCCDVQPLDGRGLADAIEHLLHFTPRAAALAQDGAERSAELLAQLTRRKVEEPACATY
jgi:hypothetical protein